MAPSKVSQRNLQPVRPQQYESDVSGSGGEVFDDENAEVSDVPSADGISDDDEDDGNGEDDEDGMEEDVSEDEEGEDAQAQIGSVSFGALKQAQDSLSRKRKRGSDTAPAHDEKLASLRDRLREIREQKAISAPTSTSKHEKPSKKAKTRHESKQTADYEDDAMTASDSDSAPSEEDAPAHARSSKHAPASQSSRRQVTRKRNVIDVPKRVIRDPRFDAIHNQPIHQGNTEKAYSFLVDYQKSEIAELKAAMKKSKSEDEKEELKRTVMAMENRLRAKEARDRQQAVLNKHRKEEKERVKEGKNPYYLKRSEVKERALVDRFKGMKGKEREKAVDKKRKKEGQKEKKRMPSARRAAG